MRNWLNSEWFPENARIKLANSIDSRQFEENEIDFLNTFSDNIKEIRWIEDEILTAIRGTISTSELAPREAFTSLYRSLLDRERGPKLGALLAELEKQDILDLLDGIN
jgi:lysyl-tRNA synthetase class 1